MPCDYKNNYPVNWKSEIRPAILKRAGNRCEHEGCRVKNYDIGYRDVDGKFYRWEYIENELEDYGIDLFDDVLKNNLDKHGMAKRAIKIILTVAHLDNDTTNNDYTNLKALCQYHHLRLDLLTHRINSRETRNKKKGLQSLF